MPPKQELSPKNFFLQIGIIVGLYVSTISFLSFIFDLINMAFPASNLYGYTSGYSSSMRIAISAIIVFFPLFIWLPKIYRKSVIQNEIQEGKLRKWLIYFTLFITGLAMATDVVILLNAFLGGNDITISFILKIFSVLLICGLIFYFYFKELKGYWTANRNKSKIFAYIVYVVVVVALVGGFLYIGSPATQRKITLDNQRVNDLSSIQYQVVNFYQAKGKLPQTLDETKDPISGSIIPKDPETKSSYEYKATGTLSFELCATFSAQSAPNQSAITYPAYPDSTLENWKHGVGRTCFDRTIDPQRYPQINNVKPVLQ